MRSMNESLPVGMRSRIPKPSMYFVLEATHAIFGIVYCFSDKMEGSIYSVQCAESNNGWGPVCLFFLSCRSFGVWRGRDCVQISGALLVQWKSISNCSLEKDVRLPIKESLLTVERITNGPSTSVASDLSQYSYVYGSLIRTIFLSTA